MPWVQFTADFDFKPVSAVTIAFRRGDLKLVTTACAKLATAARKGIVVRKVKTDA